MKNSITLILICILTMTHAYGQDTILWLKNNTGIVEDDLGSVTLWENQIDGYGDATQSVSALGGEQMQETYPGKVNVGFSNDGSFLELEGTNASVADNAYSVFYVGKANPTNRTAALIGNYDIDGAWSALSGSRFIKAEDGSIKFHYGTPYLQTETLSIIPGDGYFFFGFTMDASGNYKYFDNNSSLIIEGQLSKTIVTNSEDFKLNLFDDINGPETYDHTEVVEILMFDGKLSDTDFQSEYDRLSGEYPELLTAEFSVSEVLPADRLNLPATSTITITCDQSINSSSVYPKIFVNKSETEASGNWVLSPSNTLTFTPSEDWPFNALVSVQVDSALTSTDDVAINLSNGSSYNFIVVTDEDFGAAVDTVLESIATVDYPQEGHILPLKLTLPTNRTEKMPIHIWVHGGGWSGGTAATSSAAYSPQREYLAENLGVATLSIAYRCSGSSGTFSLAMEDIDIAYQWAFDNADLYNFDTTKVFFSGGSAGTPLAALASQRYPSVIGFIGFNGIYDFANDDDSWGSGNGYGQEEPSAEANSAIFQLRNNPPATILMHGDADNTIPYTQSTLFADQVNAEGGEATAVIYPGEVHAFFNIGQPAYEDVLIEMANFMSQLINPADVIDSDNDGNSDDNDPNPLEVVVTNDTMIVIEGLSATINVLKNDDFIPGLNTTIEDDSTGTGSGTVSFDASIGEFTYTPAEGEEGTEVTIDYTVCNTAVTPSVCASATILITVQTDTDDDGISDEKDEDDDNDGNKDDNDPNPLEVVVTNDTMTVVEGLSATINVLKNDDFLPTNSLTIENDSTGTALGTVRFDALGGFTYTSVDGEEGTEVTIDYTVCNTAVTPNVCASATIIINVQTDNDNDGISDEEDEDDDNDGNSDDNDPNPLDVVATNDTMTVVEGLSATINVLENDDFLPGDNTTIMADTTGTALGTVSFDASTGEFTYTPADDEEGTEVTIDYTVCNTAVTPSVCASATIIINVQTDNDNDGISDKEDEDDDNDGNSDDNDPNPLEVMVTNDTMTVVEGLSATINVLENDDFMPGDSTTIVDIATGTGSGTVSFDASLGEFTYTPADGEEGTEVTIDYTVCNTAVTPSVCASATIIINVQTDTNDDGETTDIDYTATDAVDGGEIIIYPNPLTKGALLQLQINTDLNENQAQVEIRNIAGQIVLRETLSINQNTSSYYLNVNKLKTGTYILKIQSESIVVTQKFIIQN